MDGSLQPPQKCFDNYNSFQIEHKPYRSIHRKYFLGTFYQFKRNATTQSVLHCSSKMSNIVASLVSDLETQKWTDCTFEFDENGVIKVIRAHKLILSAASEVFNAMFYSMMKEKSAIPIADTSASTFSKLIR